MESMNVSRCSSMNQSGHALFTSLFYSSIRTLLNWERMSKEEWPIIMFVVVNRSQLAKFYLPWYISQSEEANYEDRNSHPIPLSDLPLLFRYLGKERKNYIRKIAASFKRSVPPVQLVSPAYAIAEGAHILLDGNHRAAALMSTNVDFRMVVFSVLGPLDSDALPDLARWQSGQGEAEGRGLG